MSNTVEIMDFTESEETIKFKVAPDTFECAPDIPLGAMQKINSLRSGLSKMIEDEGPAAICEIFEIFMLDDSFEVFKRRVLDDKRNPIGLKYFTKILPWLLEQYGLRPTQPSDDSSDGLNDGETGISSTDGVQLEESTP